MALNVLVDGEPEWTVGAYTVTEDASPLNAAQTQGGASSISIDIPERPNARGLWGKEVTIVDTERGTTTGKVTSIAGTTSHKITLVADSRMLSLNVEREMPPYHGTLGQMLRDWFASCGLTDGIAIEDDIDARPVTFAGWNGNVLDALKELCYSRQIEASLVSNNITIRTPRGIVANMHRTSQKSWTIQTGELAQKVIAQWEERAWKGRGLVYPPGGWNEDVDVLQVDAGELLEVELRLDPEEETGYGFSATSVEQPICVAGNVWPTTPNDSVYVVSGNDGKPIQPAQWAAGGGTMSVEVKEGGNVLLLKVQASSETQYAPYRIMMPSDTSSGYSSLRIVGEGVAYERNQLEMEVPGITADMATREIGVTIPPRFLSSYGEAWAAAQAAVQVYGIPDATIGFAARGINRIGEVNSARYPTDADFEADYGGMTTTAWDALYSGWTVEQWDEMWRGKVRDSFENQAFGNIGGARFKDGDSWYRIASSTASPATVGGTAVMDNTDADFAAVWGGKPVEAWDAVWAGKAVEEWTERPMYAG